MPILIDEVVITVEVGQDSSGEAQPRGAAPAEDRTAMVSECVERVLEILAQREER